MNDAAFILCDGLVKIYKVANLEVFALQGLDLTVARGEMLGIVGSSGSGKSTLMNILGGLDRPSAGRVIIDGHDLLKMSYEEITRYRRQKIGFVWQQAARNLIPYLTALENLRVPITINARPWSKEKKHAQSLLESVGLADRMHHRLTELSGGEQQRVAIAVALANNPTLLLADEPTGELDTANAIGIFQLLRNLNRQFNLTTIIVSHDQNIAHHVDRVVAIRDGKTSTETVRQSAKPAEISADTTAPALTQFEELYLLDSAGRLQLPREYLEKFNISGRVTLDLVEEGILIRPVVNESKNASDLIESEESPVQTGARESLGLRSWWKQFRSGRSTRHE